MRIFIINSVCGVGSTGRITTDLYNVLKEERHECCIAYGRGNAPESVSTIQIGSKLDVYTHALYSRITDKTAFASRKATRKLINQIAQYNPDVIHLHNLHGYYVNLELLFDFIQDYGKPVIWTLHDCWAFTGHCAHFDLIGCNKWKVGCNHCPQRKCYPTSWLLDNSNNNYLKKKEIITVINHMTLVTPSKWLRHLVEQSYLGQYPLKVINNGIDIDRFKPMESAFRKKYNLANKFIMLGVANIWNKQKGYEFFIELSKQLQEDEVIVLVGLTEKQCKKLSNHIIGITKTTKVDEVIELYSAADVFINPTFEDTFPTVNLEALSCGTPVITFMTGGSIESIDESCGIVVEKGNLTMMIGAIQVIKEKGKKAYSDACTQRAAELYNKKDRLKEYIDLYHSLI